MRQNGWSIGSGNFHFLSTSLQTEKQVSESDALDVTDDSRNDRGL